MFNNIIRSVRQARACRSFSVLEKTRERLLAPLRNQLTFDGWETEENKAATKAASYIPKVLDLSKDELLKLATTLTQSGDPRCEEALRSPDNIQQHAELLALCFFEKQYSRYLTEMLQDNTDFWGINSAMSASDCCSIEAASVVTDKHVEELVRTGVVVIDHALDAELVLAARAELQRVHVAGELKVDQHQKENNVRNDLVGWIDSSSVETASGSSSALAPVFSLLRGVPAEIERHSNWKLSVPALVQAALYNGSDKEPSFYQNHLDCGDPTSNPRRVTALFYLNPDYDATRHGGYLRAFLPRSKDDLIGNENENERKYIDVEPVGGRLLLFNSCEVEHQVLPATASRMAMTLWALAPIK
jgi:SM-20-related protein